MYPGNQGTHDKLNRIQFFILGFVRLAIYLLSIVGPMKEFFKEVEEIREVADKIDAKINEVKKLQTQILNSPKVRSRIWAKRFLESEHK